MRSAEPALDPIADALTEAGVTVDPYDPATGAVAQMGLTGAVAGVAATGSLVLHANVGGAPAAGQLQPRLRAPRGPARGHPR